MRPGQYDAAGHQTLDVQLEDLFPDLDDLNVPYDLALYDERVFPIVTGGAGAKRMSCGPRVPAGARRPDSSPPSPPEESLPAAQLLDVSEPGWWSRPGSR